MIRVGLLAAGFLLVGCGSDPSDRDPLQLSEGHKSEFNTDDSLYSTGYICDDTGSSTLAESTNQGSSPTLTFSFHTNNGSNKERLTSNPTQEQRCNEIIGYVLSDPSIEFNFHSLGEKDRAAADGGARVPLKLQWVTLKYQDGTRNEHSAHINLRCESDFTASCMGSKCEDYIVHVPNEACTFRASHRLFEFSHHKRSVMDLNGEIDFRGETNPVFKITSLAVVVEN